jgi:hypothetical protein
MEPYVAKGVIENMIGSNVSFWEQWAIVFSLALIFTLIAVIITDMVVEAPRMMLWVAIFLLSVTLTALVL